jgi:hypothetical protein
MMLVPVGRGRMFFHAGCGRVKVVRDEGDDGLKAERETSSAWLRQHSSDAFPI